MAAHLEELIARRDLDDRRDVAARRNGNAQERKLDAEDVEALLVETETVVCARGIPGCELDHELEDLFVANRGDAEEILDVDDAETADLHVVLDELRPEAVARVRRLALHADHVVGDEAMAAHDEIERALALPDAGLADDQDADAEDVHEHAVQRRRG